VFGEDPRYYRMDHGSVKKRLLHAATHVFVTHQNSGREEFNFSEWAGLASVTTVRKIYHPGARIGFQATVRQVGVGASVDIGSDILREFWPEISRKLKIPFVSRDHANQSKE
jgi:hypothetical protein